MKKVVPIRLEGTIGFDRETGKVMAVYFRVRPGKAAETKEFANGNAFADYDSKGRLLGLELLGPCKVTVLDRISRGEPKPVKSFFRNSVPAQMLVAG